MATIKGWVLARQVWVDEQKRDFEYQKFDDRVYATRNAALLAFLRLGGEDRLTTAIIKKEKLR
jgi:hypothetical protein